MFLTILAPNASAKAWCPKQMPKKELIDEIVLKYQDIGRHFEDLEGPGDIKIALYLPDLILLTSI